MENPGFKGSSKRKRMYMYPVDSETKRKGPRTIFIRDPRDHETTARIYRGLRKSAAHYFRYQYLHGCSGMDRKTCIWSCDSDSWKDKSSGISWVGVHGSDSVCVVTRTGVLDIERACSIMKRCTIESFLHKYRETLIAEIEELVDPLPGYIPYPQGPDYLRRDEKSIKKTFGIVSVGKNEVPKESDIEAIKYDVKKAIKSLRKRMKSDADFTTDETIQAAISAFQHLFGKKFKANEIGVTVLDPKHDEAKYKEYVKEPEIHEMFVKELEIHDIEKHLTIINELDSEGISSYTIGVGHGFK